MLELRLFGPGRATYDDQALAGFPHQIFYYLLCYLVLNRRQTHSRERLAAVFWSEHSTRVSRRYLRDALWRLRRALQTAGVPEEKYLSITNESVAFVGSSNYWLDTEVFEATLVHFQPIAGVELGPDEAEQIEEAVELYTGDLLEGVYADWYLYDRERLNVLYLNALGKLMAFHEVNGTYEKGLAYGKRILAHDNTREKIHRQMMQLYWLQGDRNAALAQYKQCVQILHSTFDIGPMEETKRLYEQMLNNRYRLPGQIKPSMPIAKPETAQIDPSILKTTRYTLNKLRQIQATLDEANAELRHVEQLINAVLGDSDSGDSASNFEM